MTQQSLNSQSGTAHLALLSGLLCDDFMWQAVVPKLQPPVQVKTFSFAGFHSLTEMAAHVLHNMPTHFSLVGHSMGGRVAIEMYRQAPDRITHLGLLNTGAHPCRESEVVGRQHLLDLARDKGMAAVVDEWLPPMMSARGIEDKNLMRALAEMVLRHSVSDFSGEIQALLKRPNAESTLPNIAVPTLLLSGSEDNWSPLGQHRDMQSLLSDSARADSLLIELAGVGHMSPVEAPDQIAEAIGELLSR